MKLSYQRFPLLRVLLGVAFVAGIFTGTVAAMEKMVLIEANIWEINEQSNFDYGVVWDLIDLDPEVNDLLDSSIFLPGMKDAGPNTVGAFITAQGNIFKDRDGMKDIRVAQINATLQTSLREGSVHLRANPKLIVKNGGHGVIHSGNKVPFTELRTGKVRPELFTEFKNTGVTLTVTPRIEESYPDFIRLDVLPDVSDITSFVRQETSEGAYDLPVFSTRKVKSQVIVRSGGTIILSGLIAEQKTDTTREVPLISKIPALGWLFRSNNQSRTKSDILIEITATIVSPGESRFVPNGLIYEGEIFQSDSDVATQLHAVEQSTGTEAGETFFNPDEWFVTIPKAEPENPDTVPPEEKTEQQ
jgi:type II secretory pathway component GspD/PulD (secretin)